MLQKVEEGMVEHFINENIPEEFQPIFRRQLREGKDQSVEGLILEVADKMDQVYEAFAELQRGIRRKNLSLCTVTRWSKSKISTSTVCSISWNRFSPT